MDVSGGAMIVPRAVLVELGGVEYTIPAQPAAVWILTVLEKDMADIVPGMLDGDLEALHERLFTGEVTAEECQRAAQDAVTAAAGCPWWSAVRLVHSAARDPAAMGELRMSGIDPTVAPFGAALVALYRIYTRDREKKDVAKVDAELARLPAGVSAIDARYDEAAAAASFEAMFAARGGR